MILLDDPEKVTGHTDEWELPWRGKRQDSTSWIPPLFSPCSPLSHAASWAPCSPCHGSCMQWLEMGSSSNLWPKSVAVSARWWQLWCLEEWQVGECLGYP